MVMVLRILHAEFSGRLYKVLCISSEVSINRASEYGLNDMNKEMRAQEAQKCVKS